MQSLVKHIDKREWGDICLNIRTSRKKLFEISVRETELEEQANSPPIFCMKTCKFLSSNAHQRREELNNLKLKKKRVQKEIEWEEIIIVRPPYPHYYTIREREKFIQNWQEKKIFW